MLLGLVLSLFSLLEGPHLGREDHWHPKSVQEWAPTQWGPQSVEEEEITRNALHGEKYGGDMVLPEGFNHTDGAGIRNTRRLWPGYPGRGFIPYVIHPALESNRSLILSSMEQYHQNTCIRFVPRITQRDYIEILPGNGCYSFVGRSVNNQPVSLGQGCLYIGVIVHELGHAIGLFHEHQRSDRDQYINVYPENVVIGKELQFRPVLPINEMIFTSYDYDSIMHYGNYVFSKDPGNLKTMEAKDGRSLAEPYDKPGLTKSDIQTINMLYKCRTI